MIIRDKHSEIKELLSEFPAVGIVGARQVGKTTLVKSLFEKNREDIIYLDLERPSDANKLQNAEFFFETVRDKIIVIDEIQRMPELFPLLRYEIDQDRRKGRFILLGSSSPELLRSSSESLAGRIQYVRLDPFNISEVGSENWKNLWLRGGFPESYLKNSNKSSFRWLQAFISAYIERDLPLLGLNLHRLDMQRLMQMLAHHHGQVENASHLAKSMGVSQPTIKKAMSFLEQSFSIYYLNPWFTNVKKRITKSPKVYISDTGFLHAILGIDSMPALLGNPIAGFSFESFVIGQIISQIDSSFSPYFYRTQDGTESDLVLVKNNKVVATFEVKLSQNPKIGKSISISKEDLNPEKSYIITPENNHYQVNDKLEVVGVEKLLKILENKFKFY